MLSPGQLEESELARHCEFTAYDLGCKAKRGASHTPHPAPWRAQASWVWVEPGFGSWGWDCPILIHTDLHQGGPKIACLFTHSQMTQVPQELASLNGSSSSPISESLRAKQSL